MHFSLTETSIDPTTSRHTLLNTSAGAYCSYEGWVRDHNEGEAVNEIHYSGYVELAPSVAKAILGEAKQKFHLLDAAVIHRIGVMGIGEIAVWVGVTAHHRGDTFLGCRYIIDNIKHRLPIWKKERYANGSEQWIENNHCGCIDLKNLEHHQH